MGRRRFKSPASPLFTQPFIKAQIKEDIIAPHHWPLWEEFTGDRWVPRTKGQQRGKNSTVQCRLLSDLRHEVRISNFVVSHVTHRPMYMYDVLYHYKACLTRYIHSQYKGHNGRDRIIFIMGILLLVKRPLFIETDPSIAQRWQLYGACV